MRKLHRDHLGWSVEASMVQLVTLAFAVIAVVPAAALFFTAYGRYDGLFRDNVVFLYFIGGLLVGGFLGFLSLLFYAGLNELIAAVGVALLLPIALVAVLNRKKWQGERHAVFNAGALGLGTSVMIALSFLYYQSVTLGRQACVALSLSCDNPPKDQALLDAMNTARDAYVRQHAFTLPVIAQGVLLAVGITGLLFALGLFAGDAVRQRRQFRGAFLGTAMLLAPSIFLAELMRAWQAATGGEWLWTGTLALYGFIVGVATERKLLPEGVAPEMRKIERRRKRAEARE